VGYNVAWLAFRGIPREKVLAVTGFAETNNPDEYNESPVSGIQHSNEWYVLHINNCFHPLISQKVLNRLSEGCEILGCQIEEHIMASASFFYKSGRRVWNLLHDCEKGPYHLEVDGNPPEILCEIRERLFAEQDAEGGEEADVDFAFDVPIKVAETLTGFVHNDHDGPAGRPMPTALVPLNG
jgi:hypothetical protein